MTGRSGHTDRTQDPASGGSMLATCHTAFNRSRLISTVILLTGHYAQTDRTLSIQRPVVSSKVPEMIFHNRTCPVMPDRTNPASGPSTSPLCALRQRTSALTGHTLPASDHLTDASVFAVTPDRTRRSNRGQHPVTPSDLCLFCLGRRWHRRTVRTLWADTPPVEFLTLAPKLHHP